MGQWDLNRIIDHLEKKPLKYEELCSICDKFFSLKRQKATSHRVYFDNSTGSIVNIQSGKSGDAKLYQQRQIAELLKLRLRGEE